VTSALTLTALSVGFVNFGVLLWLPGALMKEGLNMEATSRLIASSSFIALPTIVIAAWLYGTWSAKRTLIASVGVTTLGLVAVMLQDTGHLGFLTTPVVPVALLIIGASAIVSMLLPYAAENYQMRIRGRATGWVAGCYKGGGLLAQVLGLMALVPALEAAAGMVAIPAVASMFLIAVLGRETQGHDLRELEAPAAVALQGAD
jgi:putative MFS transporter